MTTILRSDFSQWAMDSAGRSVVTECHELSNGSKHYLTYVREPEQIPEELLLVHQTALQDSLNLPEEPI